MKGQILEYTVQTNTGVISSEDGQRYTFDGADWRGADSPRSGMPVDFLPSGDRATEIYVDVAQIVHEPSAGGHGGGPNIGIACRQCGANVIPQKAVNWLLFIVFLLLCCPAALIYLLVQSGKPPICPICGGSSFESPAV